MVLLYYPLRPNSTIEIDRIDDYYYATDPSNPKDMNGRLLTIVEANERKIMNMKLWEP